jgi:hypothetical protein
MIYAVEIPSSAMVFLSSFMKVSAGVQAILRFLASLVEGLCYKPEGRGFKSLDHWIFFN